MSVFYFSTFISRKHLFQSKGFLIREFTSPVGHLEIKQLALGKTYWHWGSGQEHWCQ